MALSGDRAHVLGREWLAEEDDPDPRHGSTCVKEIGARRVERPVEEDHEGRTQALERVFRPLVGPREDRLAVLQLQEQPDERREDRLAREHQHSRLLRAALHRVFTVSRWSRAGNDAERPRSDSGRANVQGARRIRLTRAKLIFNFWVPPGHSRPTTLVDVPEWSPMMAHNPRSTPEPRPLEAETAAALREAILQLWERPADGDAALHAALARMVAEARRRGLRAEEVIIAFKELLAGVSALQSGGRRLEVGRFRERLITLCIKAYYTP
jgi:hypothetical protein